MEKLKIFCYPSPVLRLKADEIKAIDKPLRVLAEGMLALLKEAKGLGLAGNQVGQTRRILVVEAIPDILDEPLVLVNPVLRAGTGTIIEEEGCLSFPGVHAEIRRNLQVEAAYRNLAGAEMRITARGLLARVIQHEIDHLDGVLYPDRLSFLARRSLLRSYRRKKEMH